MRIIMAVWVVLQANPALALIDTEQSVLDRPLVLPAQRVDGHGGLHLYLVTEPNLDLADSVHLPIGVAYGFGGNFEAGLELDTNVRPDFFLAFSPHARLSFLNDLLAIGIGTTVPLSEASRAIPLRLELPAFRYERPAGGVQAVVRWNWVVPEGGESLDLDAVGFVRFAHRGFAALDFGMDVIQWENTRIELGLGLGWFFTQRLLGKLQVYTTNLETLADLHFVFFVVHRWLPAENEHPRDDWL